MAAAAGVADYHGWGLDMDTKEDIGVMIDGARRSSDRERLTGDAVKQGTRIMRTMDVDVSVDRSSPKSEMGNIPKAEAPGLSK